MVDIINIKDIKEEDIKLVSRALPTRFESALKYQNESDFLRSIAGSLLIIKNYSNIKDDDIYYINNKPLIKSSYFNISHSGDIVVFATDKDIIGIDVEEIKNRDLKIIFKVFQKEEIDYIDNDINRFYKLWCMKESVSKALGLGLDIDFLSFNVLPFVDNKPIIVLNKEFYNNTYIYADKYCISISKTKCF